MYLFLVLDDRVLILLLYGDIYLLLLMYRGKNVTTTKKEATTLHKWIAQNDALVYPEISPLDKGTRAIITWI
jgi:hypothetical protein